MSKVCKIFKWCACGWGGSSGASNLSDLNDVSINNLQDGQVIAYNEATNKFQNVTMDGSDVLTSDVTSNVAIGWIEAGTTFTAGTSLESIIRQMLVAYINPVITIEPAYIDTFVYYKWESVEIEWFDVDIIRNSLETTAIVLYKNNEIVHSDEIPNVQHPIFDMDYVETITTDTTFRARANDSWRPAVYSNEIKFTFVDGSYFGQVADTVTNPTADDITALTKLKNTTKGYTANNISMTYGKLLYAYPASYGDLTSIKDANNFEYITSYTKSTVTIDGVSYNCYLMTDAAGVTGFKQIYS